MIHVFLIATALIAIAIAALAIGVIIKGKFPDTHMGHNAEMKKLGISCAKKDETFCQGRSDSEGCRGCSVSLALPNDN